MTYTDAGQNAQRPEPAGVDSVPAYTDEEFERDCFTAFPDHMNAEDAECCACALERIIADRNRWKQRALDAEAREADCKGRLRGDAAR